MPMILAACSGDSGGTDATAATDATDSTANGSTAATSGASVDTASAPTSAPTDGGPESSTGPGTTTEGSTGPGMSTGPGATDGTDTGGSTEGSSTTDASAGTSGTSTGVVGECSPGEVVVCYSGPPGTAGVGLCAAGEQVCDGGGVLGPCEGEVLPAMESCDEVGDEDCDGFDPCGGDGAFVWSRTFGAAGEESGMRIAFDGAGNLVIAAQGTSSIDLGGGVLNSAGGHDLFLGRFSPDGEHLWSKRFGDGAQQFNDGFALAVDAAGEIAVAGDFEGTIDFGGGPLVAKNVGDPFLVRFTADGGHVWSKAFKTGSYAYPQGLAFDAAGALVLGGYFLVSLDLGGGVMNSAGLVDAFVGKFGPDGAHQWSQRFGDAQGQFVLGLVTDAANNIYVGGGYSGAINLGKGPLVSAGGTDVFLARLGPNGSAVWSKSFGDAKPQVLRDLAIDGKGRLSFGGDLQGQIDLGGGPIGDASSHSFIAQLDADGGHLWSHLVSDGQTNLRGVAVDGLGSVLLTGDFGGSNDFGGGKLVSEGGTDLYVVKLGPGGQHVWSQRFGDFQGQIGMDVAGSKTGFVAVTGSFAGGVDFGGGPVNSKGAKDGFLVAFGP